MDEVYVKALKDVLKLVRNHNNDEKSFLFNIFMKSYMSSIFTFGKSSNITKDTVLMWKQFKESIMEEYRIHEFLIRNYDKINYDACIRYLDSVDELNEKTFLYYLKVLGDIQDACSTKCELRAKPINKNFSTIIETDEYQKKASGLTLTFSDVKQFLGYDDQFWDFVEKKIKFIDGSIEKNKAFYSTLMKFDSSDNLKDIKVIVPYVVDLESALVNVHEFTHAHDLYFMIGKPVVDEPEYEKRASLEEENFSKNYVKNLVIEKQFIIDFNFYIIYTFSSI